MNIPPDETTGGWSPIKIGAAVFGVLVLLLLIPTFRGSSTTEKDSESAAPDSADVSQSQCERSLMSAMDGLEPSRLGISSERRVMIDTLNNWSTQCVDQTTPVVDEIDQQRREELLSPDAFKASQSDLFQLRDAEHVRNGLLAAAIVDRLAVDLRSDHDRALELFYYVVRTLDLIPDDGPDLRLSPYESLVYGRGTAADRGWTYALLMRQLRLDVVMIQPRGAEETSYWLLGAILPGEGVMLLDPRLGLPIISRADADNPQSALPSSGAMLADVRQSDDLLRQFDEEDRRYPLSAQDLQIVDVYAIGTSSTFAPRLARLQMELPEPVELFDGLSSSQLREEGLINRITAAGADGLWTADQVHVWPYPERAWSGADERTEENQQLIAGIDAVLAGPKAISITISPNEQGELQLGTDVQNPQRTLREIRLLQLEGHLASAQQAYLQPRLNNVNLGQVQRYFASVQETIEEQFEAGQIEDVQAAQQSFLSMQQAVMQEINGLLQNSLPDVLQLNGEATDMATYWSAQTQYEQQDYALAAQRSLAYVERFGGRFTLSAVYLASISLAQDGRPGEAVELFQKRPPDVTPSLGALALVKRWRQLSEDSDDSGDSAESAESDTDAPADSDDMPEPTDSSKPPDEQSDSDPPSETPNDPAEDKPGEPQQGPSDQDPPADTPATGTAEEEDAPSSDDTPAVDSPPSEDGSTSER